MAEQERESHPLRRVQSCMNFETLLLQAQPDPQVIERVLNNVRREPADFVALRSPTPLHVRSSRDLTRQIHQFESRIHHSDRQPTRPSSHRRSRSMASSNVNTFPPLDTSFTNRSPSPAAGQVNGAGTVGNGVNYMQPIPAGHQQDLNYLYAQIQELSSILAQNREKVNEITYTAEEVARRANLSNGTSQEDDDHAADKAKVRELEHELAKASRIIELYKHEQRENTALIAMYEDAMGTATEQIRNYCNDIDTRFLAQRRQYNNLLQAEKDEHLQSRLDRDHWQAQTLRVCEMIRTAARLRNDEWCDEYRVVRGLQEEVRCLRNCLGMEPEKLEEETGWEYLREDPSQNPNHERNQAPAQQ